MRISNIIDSKYLDWPGAKQIIRLERQTLNKGEVCQSTTYAITSLPRDQADANVLLSLLRGRWLIECRFHILDAHLREGHCRIRTGNAAHACCSIRYAALNLARKLRYSATAMCQEHAANVSLLCQRMHIIAKLAGRRQSPDPR
ncbi:MAG: transposase [Planctomycetaceae bacterium]|nr:transposase [Planctomycetaceae bacterium]